VTKRPADIRSLARAYTDISIETLGGYVTQPATDPEIRIRAIGMLLDRGWGKPEQATTNEIKGELNIIMRKVFDDGSDVGGEGT